MKSNKGFTLIEVLIALAILTIALTAIIKATSQNIKNTIYIQNKTIAAWVGTQVVNEARIGILKLPLKPDSLKENTEMLGRKWEWEANLAPTPNPKIKEIHVFVFDQTHSLVSRLTSYTYIMQNE